jgi:hypothetical protein
VCQANFHANAGAPQGAWLTPVTLTGKFLSRVGDNDA